MDPDPRQPVAVVALVASAGGLDALSVVLRDLPVSFPSALVVYQHLGGASPTRPPILAARTRLRVDWAQDGDRLRPGHVVVCPPGMDMELLADGSCRLRRFHGLGVRRFDALLTSMARSYGKHCIAVVLSGSGEDGAQGAAALHQAGAVVIAQSPQTAAHSSMPAAAARAGAAQVVPVGDIGRMLTACASGEPMSRWCEEFRSAPGGVDDEWGAGQLTRSPGAVALRAGARVESVRRRLAELRCRTVQLAAGGGVSVQTVAAARRRLEESMRFADLARRGSEDSRRSLSRSIPR